MYQFKIRQMDDGGYRFELGGIKMLVDGFTVKDDRHILNNPNKTIAYFNIGDNIYGVSNEPLNFHTAEEFYDAMNMQYGIFTSSNTNPYDTNLYANNSRNISSTENNNNANFKRTA